MHTNDHTEWIIIGHTMSYGVTELNEGGYAAIHVSSDGDYRKAGRDGIYATREEAVRAAYLANA